MSIMNTRRRTEVLIKSIDSFVENQKREIQESFRKHTLETFCWCVYHNLQLPVFYHHKPKYNALLS